MAIAAFAYYANKNLLKLQEDKKQEIVENQRIREQEIRRLVIKEKQEQDELERKYKPHIEFTLDAEFLGPQKGKYIAEFIIYANNKSLVRHEFKKIEFRVLGIKKEEELCEWKNHPPRLYFPHEIIDPKKTDIFPGGWNFIFVEPGVKQRISFAAPIDADYAYIVAHAKFNYDSYTPHTIERVFALNETSQSAHNG